MEKHVVPASANIVRQTPAQRLMYLLLVMGMISAATVQTAHIESSERQGPLQPSNAALQANAPVDATVDGIQALNPPAESHCFTLHQFVPDYPQQRLPVNHSAAASGLPLIPFRYSQDFPRQHVGVCTGQDGLHLTYQN